MKRFLNTLVFFFISFIIFAQKNDRNYIEGQNAYKRMQFVKALELFQKAYSKDTSSLLIKEKIAHCYRRLQDTKQAEFWYAQVVKSPFTDPEDKIYYAQALASNNKHAEAQLWYNAYAKQVRDDPRALSFAMAYMNLDDFYKDSAAYKVRLSPFNSKESDFSPAYWGKRIAFVSNRNHKAEKFKWDNSSFLEIFFYEDGKVKEMKFDTKTHYHEGPLAIFPKGDSMIFTRNNQRKSKSQMQKSLNPSDKINKLKLFLTFRQSNGSWGKEKEFPHNVEDFNTMHPALSPDGKTLYFASDRVGSLGGMDLYVSRFEEGQWSLPENLGNTINTRGNEAFPFVDSKGNLYFASNGHGGLGGFDIFIAEYVGGKFMPPVNLGYPINSIKDDFGFIYKPETQMGFLSSNREGGLGKDDIYEFSSKRSFSSFNELTILTRNAKTLEPIGFAEIEIRTAQKTALYFTGDNGVAKHFFNKKLNYDLTINKQGFETVIVPLMPEQIATKTDKDTLIIDLPYERQSITIIRVFDEETKAPLPVKMTLSTPAKNIFQNKEIENGRFEQNFDKGSYEVGVWTAGYFYQFDDFKVLDKKAKTNKMLPLKPLRKGALWLTQIEFEKNLERPKRLGLKEMEYIAKTMQENPSLQLRIMGYAQDFKQSNQNEALAKKRAKFVYDYLISKKIAKERLVYEGYYTKPNSLELEVTDVEENTEQQIKSIFDE
jgi:outer membrane protein OmpA-like peptidoglycan-associated protein